MACQYGPVAPMGHAYSPSKVEVRHSGTRKSGIAGPGSVAYKDPEVRLSGSRKSGLQGPGSPA